MRGIPDTVILALGTKVPNVKNAHLEPSGQAAQPFWQLPHSHPTGGQRMKKINQHAPLKLRGFRFGCLLQIQIAIAQNLGPGQVFQATPEQFQGLMIRF